MTRKKEVSGPTKLIHIDEFLATNDSREEVKSGFRIFMRGRSYQYSYKDFEKELENYFKREI